MVDRSDIKEPVIVIADRGYESFNVFEHIKQKGWKYVIRIKDRYSYSIAARLSPPDQEFDIEFNTILTRRQTKEIKSHPEKYSFLSTSQKFDYLPVGNNGEFPMNFRIVRFAISENNYEVIITNLSKEDFPMERIKEIYYMRWGIMPISALFPLCRHFFNADFLIFAVKTITLYGKYRHYYFNPLNFLRVSSSSAYLNAISSLNTEFSFPSSFRCA